MRKRKKSKHELAMDSAQRKVDRILRKAFGERAKNVGWGTSGILTMNVIEAAFRRRLGTKDARMLGFQMGDWGRDAGSMLALHLFPERFTRDEVYALILDVVVHVPNHIVAGAALLDESPRDVWGVLAAQKKKKKRSRA